MNQFEYGALEGSKQVHKWLLISEKKSGSTAHVDVGYATWLSCMAGKKTIWIRNPDRADLQQWSDLDVEDDYKFCDEPWGRIDLLPGSTLVFPPGTVHTVFTQEDSVFARGHFLTPQIMDRFLDVLGQTEMASRTNDLKGIDFFRILENFIDEALTFSADLISKKHFQKFVLAMEDYLKLKLVSQSRNFEENEHLKRRKTFVNTVHQKNGLTN